MAEPIIIQIKGIEEVKRYLKDKNIEALRKVSAALNQSVLFLEAQIKNSISHGTNAPIAVDTGNFMRSTTSEVYGFTGRIINYAEYGQYVEYGTSKMPARPHFRNTVFANQNKIEEFMKAKIKEIEN